MTRQSVISAWQGHDLSRLPELLAGHVIFSSPAADYCGHADAAHMLSLIPEVLTGLELTDSWEHGPHETLSAFRVHYQDQELDGLLREERDDSGLLTHVTLFLRPYVVLRASMGRMRELLASRPLPGA